MKTPREILLRKHQSAEADLDALRKEFVADLARSSVKSGCMQDGPLVSPGLIWQGFVRIMRWHLAGLAAVWLLILGLRFADGAGEAPRMSKQSVVVPATVILTLKENRRQILEFGDAPSASVPPVLPTPAPSRRGLLQRDWAYS